MSLAKHIFALVLFASRADAGNMVEPLVNLELNKNRLCSETCGDKILN